MKGPNLMMQRLSFAVLVAVLLCSCGLSLLGQGVPAHAQAEWSDFKAADGYPLIKYQYKYSSTQKDGTIAFYLRFRSDYGNRVSFNYTSVLSDGRTFNTGRITLNSGETKGAGLGWGDEGKEKGPRIRITKFKDGGDL
jgi:hypothetical protein